MNFNPTFRVIVIAVCLLALRLQAQETSFTYQGILRNGSAPAQGTFDLRFKVYADALGNTQVGTTMVRNGIGLSNGLFTVSLDAVPNVFTGANRWLEVALKTNGAASYTVMSPLQPITPAPYSMFANVASNLVGSVTASQLPASVVLNNASQVSLSGTFSGNAVGLSNLNASALTSGTIPDARLAANVARTSQVWMLGGNAGASPADGAFFGTIDNQPVELRVNGAIAMRFEPTASGTPNIVGGSYNNFVEPGTVGATIGGGGLPFNRTNSVGGSFSVIGGGQDNRIRLGGGNSVIGGGFKNAVGTNAVAAVIGGGWENRVANESSFSTVGGGVHNQASNSGATVPGGQENVASGINSFASGEGTRASALAATSMGYRTAASGPGSTALGVFSKARHDNTFVWSDGSNPEFGSSANNQFLVNASGGVGLGTTNPMGALHVYSTNNPTVVRVQSTGTPGFGRVEFVSNPQGDGAEWRPGYIQSLDAGNFTGGLGFFVNGSGAGNRFTAFETMRVQNGRVGIGNTVPSTLLQVANATCDGTTWNNASDRNLKDGFAPVDLQKILAAVAALPIRSWHYTNDPATRHVGPTAQDFHAAFGLGADEKRIATVDADGVALAAIQGLNEKLKAELDAKEARISELEKRLLAIEALLQK
jgi:trimeric autotransporter adhesin